MADLQSTLLSAETTDLVLTLDCPEESGIVHAVTGVLLDHGCTIVELKQFDDRRSE